MDATPQRRRPAIGLLAGLVAAVAVLYFFPPDQFRLYPRCLLYAWTGLQCPGCGGLRATHELLHGHVAAAFRLNPLFVVGLPLLALVLAAHSARWLTGRDWLRRFRRPFWLWLVVAVAAAFTIARNLPFGPLAHWRG
jgi:hypothetical protein